MKWALAVAFFAAPAHAEPWIDYDLLLQKNAEKVEIVTSTDGRISRRVDLGNGITITCSELGCFGLDQNGAVGCVWSIYSELLAAAEVCDLEHRRTEKLSADFQAVSKFVAENAVPPRSVAEIAAIHAQVTERMREDRAAVGDAYCSDLSAPESDVMGMIEQLTVAPDVTGSDNPSDTLRKMLSTPRLPVANPCM